MTDIYLCMIVDVTYGEAFVVTPVTFFDTIFLVAPLYIKKNINVEYVLSHFC